MALSNDGLVAFHYSSYGTFCVHLKSSIISTVVLPTTEIIEPKKDAPLTHKWGDFSLYAVWLLIPVLPN